MPEVLVRKGVYAWMPPLPVIPGIELSGTVVEHGRNAAEPAVGQPVFVSARDLPVRAGCYAEYIAVPARSAHPLPPGCALEAAACLSNYQVAYHLLHTAARGVAAAECVLVHAAAGGVGSAAVQLAPIAGMTVIGVAGSEAKRRAVEALGAHHAIDYRSEDMVARVREATQGRGADLILDPIDGKGFGRNFAMLAPLGMVVSYGRLDGPPDADLLNAMRANSAKSPAVRFFTIHSFDDRRDIRAATMKVLMDHLSASRIRPLIHDRLRLAEAAQAAVEALTVGGPRMSHSPAYALIDRHKDSAVEIFTEQLCDMALPGDVFDQHHFADANHAALTIARGDLKSCVEVDHILPARRRMPMHTRLHNSCLLSFDKDNGCGRKPFGQLKTGGRLLGALNLNFAEMRLTIGIGIQIKNAHCTSPESDADHWPAIANALGSSANAGMTSRAKRRRLSRPRVPPPEPPPLIST
jgi:NADPH2:quinone reductase